MPELPEVETTRRGITDHIINCVVSKIVVRQHQLRQQIPIERLRRDFLHQKIVSIDRRGKYLLFETAVGWLLIHLGMSGSLRILPTTTPAKQHDHVDIHFEHGVMLRFTDPRRFGVITWVTGDPALHPLLKSLGPEPLMPGFTGRYLFAKAQGRSLSVKQFIMDGHVVVGVGNIYANEALFKARVSPVRAAGKVTLEEYGRLARYIKQILSRAIRVGGTTLRDFTGSDGKPGYFKQSLQVYGRAGQPCRYCGQLLSEVRLGGRSSVFCVRCQS